MVGDFVLLHRAEGAKADVQGDKGKLDALFFDAGEQLPGEVQAGGRRGGRAGGFGIHGLIALGVVQLFLDVGRQRHRAKLFEDFQENAVVVEPEKAVAVRRVHRFHRCGQQAAPKRQFHALAGLFARAGQAFPEAAAMVGQQQDFNRRRAALGMPHQARRDDAGVVHHQAIARVQIVGQVGEVAMGDAAGSAVEHQKARGVALRKRVLRDQTLGKVKIKITLFHKMMPRGNQTPARRSSFVIVRRW